jgi:hypothetical protein
VPRGGGRRPGVIAHRGRADTKGHVADTRCQRCQLRRPRPQPDARQVSDPT